MSGRVQCNAVWMERDRPTQHIIDEYDSGAHVPLTIDHIDMIIIIKVLLVFKYLFLLVFIIFIIIIGIGMAVHVALT